MPNTPKTKSKRAPGLLEAPDYLQLKRKVDNLEAFIEILLFDIQGERGEKLRNRFYEKRS